METVLKKISAFVFLYYKAIIIAFALLTAFSFIVVLNMEIKTDIIDVLPKGNKTVAQFKDFMEKYGAQDHVTLIVEPENNAVEEHIDLIEALAGKLRGSSLIEYVDYSPLQNTSAGTYGGSPLQKHFPLFLDEKGMNQLQARLSEDGIIRQIRMNRQKLLSPFSSPLDSEMIDKDPLGLTKIVTGSFKRTLRDDSFDLSTGYYITKDRSAAFIFIKPKGKSRDMAFVRDFKREMDSIIASSLKETGNLPPQPPLAKGGIGGGDVRIRLAGAHILSEEVRQVIRHDIISSSVLSVVLIALLIWRVYRVRIIVLAAIGFTMLASLLMTLAFAYFIFGSLNIVTSIVAAVLIGLYVDYSMHMTKRYGDELAKNNDRQKALETVLTGTGSAIVISAVTTSLSFFSIIVTNFEGLHELGIVSGTGVLLCLISNLLLMSALLLRISKDGPQRIFTISGTSGAEMLINLVTKNARLIISIGVVLIVIAGFGLTGLRFDNDPEHIGIKDSQAVEAIKAMNRELNKKGEPLFLIVKGKDIDELTAGYDAMEKLLSGWEKDGLIGRYDSLSFFLPPPHVRKGRMEHLKRMEMQTGNMKDLVMREMEKNGFAFDKTYIDAYIDNITAAVKSQEVIGLKDIETAFSRRINLFFNKEDVSLAAYLYPPDGGWDKRSLSVIHAAVASEGRDRILTGKSILFDEIKGSIIRGSTLAVAVTLLLNVIIAYWFFKKGAHVLLVMLPVTLGFILTPGIMGYLKTPFNFINVGTVALIFGFGVDYGIYIMQAYLKEEKRAAGNALRITGKDIMMCAATTVAGCGSLVTAKFAGIASIGVVLTIGAISCGIIALVILPALLHCLEKNKK